MNAFLIKHHTFSMKSLIGSPVKRPIFQAKPPPVVGHFFGGEGTQHNDALSYRFQDTYSAAPNERPPDLWGQVGPGGRDCNVNWRVFWPEKNRGLNKAVTWRIISGLASL